MREELPNARIVADRFHVAKHYRHAADQVRKQERLRLRKELSEDEYQKLNGSFRAFRKNVKDLNKEKRKILRRFFEQSASAKQAYVLREQLTGIFNMNLSKKQAQSKILHWVQKVQKVGLHCFDDFLKLLNAWWEEITNYFIQRENSGFVEGVNNKIKVLKRRCYGIFNLSVSIWTCMVTVYSPPPYMAKSPHFQESQSLEVTKLEVIRSQSSERSISGRDVS